MPALPDALLIRPATVADLRGLCAVKPDPALHRERLHQQTQDKVFYLAAFSSDHSLLGFVVLMWEGDAHHSGYPMLGDLLVREDCRSQGIGTALVARAESLCRARGSTRLGLSVNPTDNPRALALYHRLGFRPTSAPPHCDYYTSTDADGETQIHDDCCIALTKDLWLPENASTVI